MKTEINKQMIITILKETERPGIENLIDWMESSDYFEAPASTRLDYHGCQEGGLAEHSMNVYKLFSEKNARLQLGLEDDEVTIASICHDMCKVDQYVPNILKSGKPSEAKPYVVQDDFPYGHGEKSVLRVTKHIDMTNNEMLLIRWPMGQFDGDWETYEAKVGKACPAIYAFQNADDEASKFLDYRKTD